MNEDRIKGIAKKITGKVKEQAGNLTGNRELKQKGQLDQLKGGAREALGRAKDIRRKLQGGVGKKDK